MGFKSRSLPYFLSSTAPLRITDAQRYAYSNRSGMRPLGTRGSLAAAGIRL